MFISSSMYFFSLSDFIKKKKKTREDQKCWSMLLQISAGNQSMLNTQFLQSRALFDCRGVVRFWRLLQGAENFKNISRRLKATKLTLKEREDINNIKTILKRMFCWIDLTLLNILYIRCLRRNCCIFNPREKRINAPPCYILWHPSIHITVSTESPQN